ncbi:unnamed protein product, partial [Hydatigera taeniaeformis]|uniref:Piwi domain-containing protein n=1 Tax=Hydatigena taeniaeformis TaxID=6205 RepID=A0A0R3WMI1_HYDTA
ELRRRGSTAQDGHHDGRGVRRGWVGRGVRSQDRGSSHGAESRDHGGRRSGGFQGRGSPIGERRELIGDRSWRQYRGGRGGGVRQSSQQTSDFRSCSDGRTVDVRTRGRAWSRVSTPSPQMVSVPFVAEGDSGSSLQPSAAQLPDNFNFSRPVTLKKGRKLPSRPDWGAVGKKINVIVNCWDLFLPNVSVLMYDITLKKIVTTYAKEYFVNEKAIGKYVKAIAEGMNGVVFPDGGRILYSLEPLDQSESNILEYTKEIADPYGSDKLTVEFTAKKIGEVSTSLIYQYLDGGRSNTSEMPQSAINMLDSLIKWVNRRRFPWWSKSAIFGKSSVRPSRSNLFHIHPGYSLSFRPQWKCRLNIDMVHRAFFPPGNLAETLMKRYGDDICSPELQNTILNEILFLRIEASHYINEVSGKRYKKQLVVHGLSEKSANEEMIVERGESITEYFKNRYNITLKHPKFPCVKVSRWTKKDRDEFIPMELLTVLPFQGSRSDPGVLATCMIKNTAVSPSGRFGYLEKFVKALNWDWSSKSRFNLHLTSENPVVVEARELPQPTGCFSANKMAELRRGVWSHRPFYRPFPEMIRCMIVTVYPVSSEKVNPASAGLIEAADGLGVRMIIAEVRSVERWQLETLFQEFIEKGLDLALFVIDGAQEYSQIKRLGELRNSVCTQCVRLKSLGRRDVFRNLMLKINAKMGGINWLVKDLTEVWKDEKVMVVGADVTHPTGNSQDLSTSVAAVIASISPDFMRYVTIIRQQDQIREDKVVREYIDKIDEVFLELLKACKSPSFIFGKHNNGCLPTRVIFYRDGVSEGQFESVLRIELAGMQKACSDLRPDYEPGITFIVVQKRHRIRFVQEAQVLRNVEAGTVVDTEITNHREFDFYLCSHVGIQGTSKPVHYHVLHDDNGLNSDELQKFTYYLCHAYMRCCRSVSYPAPTYYSHLAAFRARDWLRFLDNKGDIMDGNYFLIHPNQKEQMFFL